MNTASHRIQLPALQAALADLDPAQPAAAQLRSLVGAGLDRLPLPGQGDTLGRWQALAAVAAHDLSLVKLYEGHTDALAILAELGAPADLSRGQALWGVWAAESPQGRTTYDDVGPGGAVRLGGRKCWCSGASGASHAIVTAWAADGTGPQLVALAIDQPGVRVSTSQWSAVGMAGSASLDVEFDRATGTRIGEPGQYIARPGFWQGGAGIGACWWGGARSLAETLRLSSLGAPASARSPFRMAALGRVDLALESTAALLRSAAAWIDANPTADTGSIALRVRLAAEACATAVLDETGRTLGATPFCRDAKFARMAADLPVFVRQSHAERDFAGLGERALGDKRAWQL